MENLNKFTNYENFGEIEIVNSKKKGSFLEWIIKRIFQTIGFYATNKDEINNNQIDVFVNYNDIKIVVECKQYEKNTPAVKNLIYEWNSKRTEMECDKALLILWGYPKIEQDELKLAKKLNVKLWNDPIIFSLFNLILSDINKAKNEILLNLEINNEEVQKIISELKGGIEKRFKNFLLENEEIVSLLKDEIFDCFKKGILIKQKKFEIIWEFLKNREYYVGPSDSHISSLYGDDLIFMYKSDFTIKRFNRNESLYEKGRGIIGYSDIFLSAVDKDGDRIKIEEIFN